MSKLLKELPDSDRKLIESQKFDPKLNPEFDIMRMHLIWSDELPLGISSKGLELLQKLWIARAVKFHGLKLDKPFDPEHFLSIWDYALSNQLQWPGFKRQHLSERDKAYYEQCLSNLNNDDDY